jgi:hypothetical protein
MAALSLFGSIVYQVFYFLYLSHLSVSAMAQRPTAVNDEPGVDYSDKPMAKSLDWSPCHGRPIASGFFEARVGTRVTGVTYHD